VVLASAGRVLQFQQASGDSTINSLGDALWWRSAVVTTVACDLDPVTAPGRVVAVMMMVYGVFVFGYFVSRAVVFLQPGLAQRESGRASNASSARMRRQ
jgi:voltage-gated potassium channel